MQTKFLEVNHHTPSRTEAISFFLKSRFLISRRWWLERNSQIKIHSTTQNLLDVPFVAEVRSPLWTQLSSNEFPLTAGKVHNLRMAARHLNGIEIPAGEIFSFWKQLGRTTKNNGFVEGRELRGGCLVPNLGGGLCQLSGLIHEAAIKAGLQVIESHKHSRTLPNSNLKAENDATVFWNYVDLRFHAQFPWRLETRLSSTELIVVIRARVATDSILSKKILPEIDLGLPKKAAVEGDCLTCEVTSCFRHLSAKENNPATSGQGAWIIDDSWPEFIDWSKRHVRSVDQWITKPFEHRLKKAWATLHYFWQYRQLPNQSANRQHFQLFKQEKLAKKLAKNLDPKTRHIVVSQTLLPHLWRDGHLGGRTFEVLVNRWPLEKLHAYLDTAAQRHPNSETLSDFRADSQLVLAETKAFAAAEKVITPHRAIAASFGSRAILLNWKIPKHPFQKTTSPETPLWFFPASALARKGIYELVEAVQEIGGVLLILGNARENGDDPLQKISHRKAFMADLDRCTALILPAWIEHEPRLALSALMRGIPVIASRASGIYPHPLLTEIDSGDVISLKLAMKKLITENNYIS